MSLSRQDYRRYRIPNEGEGAASLKDASSSPQKQQRLLSASVSTRSSRRVETLFKELASFFLSLSQSVVSPDQDLRLGMQVLRGGE